MDFSWEKANLDEICILAMIYLWETSAVLELCLPAGGGAESGARRPVRSLDLAKVVAQFAFVCWSPKGTIGAVVISTQRKKACRTFCQD